MSLATFVFLNIPSFGALEVGTDLLTLVVWTAVIVVLLLHDHSPVPEVAAGVPA